MSARHGVDRKRRLQQSTVATAAATLSPAGTSGRVWSICLTPTTAAVCTWIISQTAQNIWIMYAPAVVGAEQAVHFPQGLAFSNGLILTEVTGVGNLAISWSVDLGAQV